MIPDHQITRRAAIGVGVSVGIGMAAAGATSATARTPDHRPSWPRTVALPVGFRPEGITSGPGAQFYVGSLANGAVVTGDLRTRRHRVLLTGAVGRAIRGLFYDRRTGLVWAAGNVGTVGHVWAIDARRGSVVADTIVPGAAFLNDLVVTRDRVYVTDSRLVPDRLTVLRLSRHGWPTSAPPRFIGLGGEWPAGTGAGVNGNGIRALPDGALLLNNSAVGGLWRTDRHTGVTRRVPVVGGPPLTGGDGLLLDGTTVYNVRGSGQAEVSVLKLHRSRRGLTATWVGARTDSTLDVPSTATLAVGALWAVNARFGTPNPDQAEYWITRLRR